MVKGDGAGDDPALLAGKGFHPGQRSMLWLQRSFARSTKFDAEKDHKGGQRQTIPELCQVHVGMAQKDSYEKIQ